MCDKGPNGGGNVSPHFPEEEERFPHDAVSIYFEAHHGHEGVHGKYHEGLDLLPHGGQVHYRRKKSTSLGRMWTMPQLGEFVQCQDPQIQVLFRGRKWKGRIH